jgi:hypothetical protein
MDFIRCVLLLGLVRVGWSTERSSYANKEQMKNEWLEHKNHRSRFGAKFCLNTLSIHPLCTRKHRQKPLGV